MRYIVRHRFTIARHHRVTTVTVAAARSNVRNVRRDRYKQGRI